MSISDEDLARLLCLLMSGVVALVVLIGLWARPLAMRVVLGLGGVTMAGWGGYWLEWPLREGARLSFSAATLAANWHQAELCCLVATAALTTAALPKWRDLREALAP